MTWIITDEHGFVYHKIAVKKSFIPDLNYISSHFIFLRVKKAA